MVAQSRRLIAEGRRFQPTKPCRGTEHPCQQCGAPVYATQREIDAGLRQFCNAACHAEWQRKEPVRKECAYCGKALELKPSRGEARFCSRSCMGLAKTARPLARSHNGKPARVNEQGYVQVWEPAHPKAVKGWMPEHRLVAEQLEGRYLEAGEEVHHCNGVKDDNRPENLQVLGGSEHAAITQQQVKDKLARLAEYERRYGPLE